MITSKICIVGDFAVGKTSVVERFVNNHFSAEYLTTVGVKIDTKEVVLTDREISLKLIIWDVAGTEDFGAREFAYLRGASGFIFVVDGTRTQTLKSIRRLHEQIEQRYAAQPHVLLVNKSDLSEMWQLTDEQFARLEQDFTYVYKTSARTGEEVNHALKKLAELIISKDLELQG